MFCYIEHRGHLDFDKSKLSQAEYQQYRHAANHGGFRGPVQVHPARDGENCHRVVQGLPLEPGQPRQTPMDCLKPDSGHIWAIQEQC